MPKKLTSQKRPAPELPPGIKPSVLPISPALRKMIREDRGIASGGANLAHKSVPVSTR
jgi:hypothetical protein